MTVSEQKLNEILDSVGVTLTDYAKLEISLANFDKKTGKTLLAKAVAGEADVPFFSMSGSDFVEMFVGVGASRVRDMFKVAKQNAPCIIFIDEIDAVGRQRGTGLGGGHDEREQTLNQLLVEMDGFSGNSGVIVMAATNRADVLDPALLRPGRFDRQIHIGKPDLKAREAILKVHARNKKLSPKVNLADIARRTPGFSGADLENLLNEAALLAARENCREIKIYHIDEAVDRVMMGPAKKSRKYSDTEKALVAYHEAGHAVIGLKLKKAQQVQKVTIVPRGQAGGYNLMTPQEETFLETKETLTAEITGLLAGRIAEELVFDQMSTGAHNDFQRATAIARAMVAEYGMSSLGPIQYERQTGSVFLGRDYMNEKNFSDQVALEIDQEVRKIINSCYEEGENLLKEHRKLLDLIAMHLVEIETLTREDIEELVNNGQLSWWEKKKAKLVFIPLNEEGRICLDNFKKVITEKTKIVAINYVSNVMGYVTPLKDIIKIAHEFNAKVIVDAAQAAPHMAIDVKDLDADFLAFSAHKMFGPTGFGVLYGKYKYLKQMEPVEYGGDMIDTVDKFENEAKDAPFKFEAGTPAIAEAIAFKEAIKYVEDYKK